MSDEHPDICKKDFIEILNVWVRKTCLSFFWIFLEIYFEVKDIVMSFHQKKKKFFFCDCNFSGIKLYVALALHEKNE